jgi:hypothetical protein
MDKIVEWVGQTKELGTQITLAKHAIEELNEKCKTPQQMRFFLDSFNVLTGMNLEFKVPRDIPSLHPELKRVLREVDVIGGKSALGKRRSKNRQPYACRHSHAYNITVGYIIKWGDGKEEPITPRWERVPAHLCRAGM